MAEFWDLYKENREKTGKKHRRGDPLEPGNYHIVVDIWTVSPDGKLLLTKRDPQKPWGGYWECTGGACQAGEESMDAAKRELAEETGLHAANLYFLGTNKSEEKQAFYDNYAYFPDHLCLNEVVLQPGETCDVRLLSFEEVEDAILLGELAQPVTERFRIYSQPLLALYQKLRK